MFKVLFDPINGKFIPIKQLSFIQRFFGKNICEFPKKYSEAIEDLICKSDIVSESLVLEYVNYLGKECPDKFILNILENRNMDILSTYSEYNKIFYDKVSHEIEKLDIEKSKKETEDLPQIQLIQLNYKINNLIKIKDKIRI